MNERFTAPKGYTLLPAYRPDPIAERDAKADQLRNLIGALESSQKSIPEILTALTVPEHAKLLKACDINRENPKELERFIIWRMTPYDRGQTR